MTTKELSNTMTETLPGITFGHARPRRNVVTERFFSFDQLAADIIHAAKCNTDEDKWRETIDDLYTRAMFAEAVLDQMRLFLCGDPRDEHGHNISDAVDDIIWRRLTLCAQKHRIEDEYENSRKKSEKSNDP